MSTDTVTDPDDYMPPPPGSRRAVLPEHVLALIHVWPYLSSACDTALMIHQVAHRHAELLCWVEPLHAMCRLTHKYTYAPCVCQCHRASSELASELASDA